MLKGRLRMNARVLLFVSFAIFAAGCAALDARLQPAIGSMVATPSYGAIANVACRPMTCTAGS